MKYIAKQSILSLVLFSGLFQLKASEVTTEMKIQDIDQIGQENSHLGSIPIDIKEINQKTLTFKDIEKENLPSLANKKAPKVAHSTMGDADRFVKRQETIILGVDEKAVKSESFDILGNNEKENINTSILDTTTWNDLKLLCGNKKNLETYFGSKLSRANTELGKSYFLGLISRPITDKGILLDRQEIVKTLVASNSELRIELDQLLKDMVPGEQQLLSFWGNSLTLPGCVHNQYYKIHEKLDESLNDSDKLLEINSFYQNLKKLSAKGIEISSSLLLPLYGIIELTGVIPTPEWLEGYATRFTGTAGAFFALLLLIKNRYSNASTALLAGATTALGLKSSLKWFHADLSIEGVVQKKLVSVAKYYKNMKKIYEVLNQEKYSHIRGKLEYFANLEEFLNHPEMQDLFDVLNANTFKSEAKYLFRKGNVLLAYQLLDSEKIQNHFSKALAAIAEIDAFVGIAKLYKEFEHKRVQFSFANYIENETPKLEIEDGWNIFVNPDGVVANSMQLGANFGTPNILLTGTNSTGKSTAMGTLAGAIICAQSIGIVPGKKMSLTIFSKLFTYKYVEDDIANDASSFQAQVDRTTQMVDEIEKLPNSAFAFSMIDEMYNGTSYEEGKAMAYAVAKTLGQVSQGMSIVATHFKDLSELEEETKRFKNYRFSIGSVEQNCFAMNRLYKLEPGISDQNMALHVARERGCTSKILDIAQQRLDRNKERGK